jgi:hypothetical protein
MAGLVSTDDEGTTIINPASFLDPLLHPISLRFPVDIHEARFVDTFATLRQGMYDTKAWCICSGFHIAYVLIICMYKDTLQPCYSATFALHGSMLYASSRLGPTSAKRRTAWFIASRLIADAILSRGMARWSQPYDISGWQSISKLLLVATGISTLWWQAIMYVLPLKWMLLTQGISLLQFHRGMTGSFCDALVASPAGQRVVACIWGAIQMAFEPASHVHPLDASHPAATANGVSPVNAAVTTPAPALPALTCLSSVLLLQVGLGYAAPLATLYFLEHRERLSFWAATCGHSRVAVAAAARIPLTTRALGALVALLVVFCVWECLLVLQYNPILL